MTEDTQLVKIPCKTCKILTNHKVEWSKITFDEVPEVGISYSTTYKILSCQGCGSITLSISEENSEDVFMNDETGLVEPIVTTTYYPKRDFRMISEMQDIYRLPPKVRQIYRETIEAYNNIQPTLCAMGIRATIESICLNENIVVEGLDNKIKELIARGIVTKKLGEGLQESRLLGNESAHQLESFGDRELLAGIRLIENVLEAHYSTPSKIDALKGRKAKN